MLQWITQVSYYEQGPLVITKTGSSELEPRGVNCYHQCLFCRNHYVLRWKMRSGALQGPTIDVFINYGSGHFWTSQQHLLGGPPSTSSSTSVVTAAGPPGSTPRGPAIDVLLNLVAITSIFLVTPPSGPLW
jgi:hypothetical protein